MTKFITEFIYYSHSLDNIVIIKRNMIGIFLITEFGTDILKEVDQIKKNLKLELIDIQFIKEKNEYEKIRVI